MAHVWFDKVQEIEKSGGKKALDELKKDIGGYTLVGEYVGSDEH